MSTPIYAAQYTLEGHPMHDLDVRESGAEVAEPELQAVATWKQTIDDRQSDARFVLPAVAIANVAIVCTASVAQQAPSPVAPPAGRAHQPVQVSGEP